MKRKVGFSIREEVFLSTKTAYRNNAIDLFRGMAALMIIFHHVASYSGALYAPYEIIPITMLIDVPAFMYLAGWSFGYASNLKHFLKQLVNLIFVYVVFSLLYISFIEIYDLIIFGKMISIREIINQWFVQISFDGEIHDIFSVVNASLWFIPMYIKVYIVFGLLIIFLCYLGKKYAVDKYANLAYILIISVLIIGSHLLQSGIISIGLDSAILFYGAFFFFGFWINWKMNIKRKVCAALFALNLIGFILLEVFSEYSWYGMQMNKFPPTIFFLLYSGLFIWVIIYFKDYKFNENTILCYVGRNAMYFFLGQGFAVSLINQYDDYIKVHWLIKYIVCCMGALVLSYLIAMTIKQLVRIIWHIIQFFMRQVDIK